MSRNLRWAILAMIPVMIVVLPKAVPEQDATLPAATPAPSRPAQPQIDAALRAIRAEPKVRDVLYQPGQAVAWQIGVLDDGTSRVGYANYICQLLDSQGVTLPSTHVRIVDIVKVIHDGDFRGASLGHVACADGRVFEP